MKLILNVIFSKYQNLKFVIHYNVVMLKLIELTNKWFWIVVIFFFYSISTKLYRNWIVNSASKVIGLQGNLSFILFKWYLYQLLIARARYFENLAGLKCQDALDDVTSLCSMYRFTRSKTTSSCNLDQQRHQIQYTKWKPFINDILKSLEFRDNADQHQVNYFLSLTSFTHGRNNRTNCNSL